MPPWLSNAIEAVLLPPGCVLAIAALACAMHMVGRRRTAFVCAGAAMVTLSAVASTSVSVWLASTLEAPSARPSAAGGLTADAIAVLGGGIGPATAPRTRPDLGDASDRVWEAARLFHAGAAPRVIAVGGRSAAIDVPGTEADDMATLLEELGVPRSALFLERKSTNTWENCQELGHLAEEHGFQRVLLVTSAMHMPRARFACERVGIPELITVPIDFESTLEGRSGISLWLPNAQALGRSAAALREHLAMASYRARAWTEAR